MGGRPLTGESMRLQHVEFEWNVYVNITVQVSVYYTVETSQTQHH